MNGESVFKRKFERERQARKQAEIILEEKALELFRANEELRALNEDLELRVAEQAKELIDSEQKYKRIIENMELGLLEVDTDGQIIKAYDWFCDMVGYTEDELLGQSANDVFLEEDMIKVLKEQDSNRMRGQAGVYEVRMKKKNGEPLWVLISGAPIYNKSGEIVGSLGIHYDITKQKNLQIELEKAKRIAEAAQEAEKQFLANMSHEIRTPLNAVIGMTHLLFDTKLSSKQKEYLSILKSSAALLRGLISDILDFSKIESGQLEVHPKEFDLIGLIKSIQKTFQLKLESKPVEIKTKIDPRIETTVLGDDLLLNQILFNLVGNSEKFTNEGTIKVTVKLLEKTGNQLNLEFKVEDTGIGIEPEKKKLIFQDFKQASNEIKLKYGGTGLGLAITKRLVEMQGGSIEVDSVYGQGTTFTFNLTYEDTGRKAIMSNQELTQAEDFSSGKLRVLVVEDNYMNRKYISTLLTNWNIYHKMVTDGQQAIDICQKEKFDLIFMDIQMPIMNGFEATIAIRNTNNPNQEIPILALTASAMIKEREKAEEVGMSGFLTKPFTPIQLLKVISQYKNTEEEEETITEASIDEGFSFNQALDLSYLDEFYEGDFEHAMDMFEIFLEYSLEEFKELPNHLENKDREAFRKLTHKLKPAMSMVGLTWITKQMQQLEKAADNNASFEALGELLQIIQDEIEKFRPILEEDLEKLRLMVA
jgi:PAS domain S-box-containing protein